MTGRSAGSEGRSGGRVGSVIARRRLGNELRRLREYANLRLDSVAAELEVSPSKISRIETGHSTAKIWDVRNLLTLYGVTDELYREQVLGWAADAKAPSWWQENLSDGLESVNYYVSLEAEAILIQCYSTPVVHALLQTEDYARAHLTSMRPELGAREIEGLVSLQSGRQTAVLGQERPFRFTIIIDESALYRRVGSEDVMRRQLRALVSTPPTVEVRVRPLVAAPHRATLSPFTIFIPRVGDLDPIVVAIEAAMTDSYVERPEDVAIFQAAFHELTETSLGTDESLRLLGSIINRH